jgi:hypothetical protein
MPGRERCLAGNRAVGADNVPIHTLGDDPVDEVSHKGEGHRVGKVGADDPNGQFLHQHLDLRSAALPLHTIQRKAKKRTVRQLYREFVRSSSDAVEGAPAEPDFAFGRKVTRVIDALRTARSYVAMRLPVPGMSAIPRRARGGAQLPGAPIPWTWWRWSGLCGALAEASTDAKGHSQTIGIRG